MRDHVRSIDADGNLIRNRMNGTAHSYGGTAVPGSAAGSELIGVNGEARK